LPSTFWKFNVEICARWEAEWHCFSQSRASATLTLQVIVNNLQQLQGCLGGTLFVVAIITSHASMKSPEISHIGLKTVEQ